MNDAKQHDDGGPAFPRPPFTPKDGHDQFAQAGFAATGHPGMTLRDWFAGMAIQGLLHQRQESGDYQVDKDDAGIVYKGPYITCDGEDDCYYAARDAYEFADAMLAARKGVLP